MGLLDFLSPALTTATGAAGAYQGAKAGIANKQREEGLQQAMLQAKMLKDQHEQKIMDALREAQTKSALREPYHPIDPNGPEGIAAAQAKRPPANPLMGSPDWLKAQEDQAKIRLRYAPPTPQSITILPGSGDKPPQGVVSSSRDAAQLGKTIPIPDVVKGSTGTAGSGGAGQNMQARLLGAVSEGRLADQRMSQYEAKHVKNGKLEVGILPDVAGGLSTGLAGAHSITGILGNKLGTRLGNATDSDYLQYQRDARLIARAEQLMSARGGSEAMASDNAFLAQGGAGAPEATIRAAQKSRRALFGNLGAVMQTLTPEQVAKLNQGLEALKDDKDIDYGTLGKEIFKGGGAPASGRGAPPPSYEDWLKARKP